MQSCAARRASVGSGGEVRQKPAGETGQLPILGNVANQDGLEDGEAIELLFPNDRVKAIMGIHVIALHPSSVEDFRAMAEEGGMLIKECLYGTVRIAGRQRLQGRSGDGAVVRNPADAPAGELLAIKVAQGELEARVEAEKLGVPK